MRIFCFILLACIGYFAPFWLFALSAVVYAMAFRAAYELFLPALLIDAQFGWHGALYGLMYTLTAGGVLLFAAVVKPYLRTHTTLF